MDPSPAFQKDSLAPYSYLSYPLITTDVFILCHSLYFTHWMWQRTLGYDLHPAIPITPDLSVACINDSTG